MKLCQSKNVDGVGDLGIRLKSVRLNIDLERRLGLPGLNGQWGHSKAFAGTLIRIVALVIGCCNWRVNRVFWEKDGDIHEYIGEI